MTVPDRERWVKVQELFAGALDVPEADRRSFVATRCGGDAELALEVLSLLAADADDPAYLDGMAAGLGGMVRDSTADRDDDLIGRCLDDRYTIEEEIARGGMGTVYRARRSDGVYDETVAVKVIHRGMDSDQIVARFKVERQILARLRHPNIANLLDGGITPDGRPYLVMEHVEGRPLDEYCAQEEVGLKGRLELLRTICGAVQHAHNNLVVHRDLKPGNILVTAAGTVKLMDFGIAKLIEGEGPDGAVGEAPATLPGLRVLTPGFASPEQIRGEPITTAADVFGLGLVMYIVLTGRRPFGGPAASAQEIARETCEADPARPSATVRPDTGIRPRRLAGDLDNICLKALRREPERRYASPGQMAEDIGHHLAGEPVHARPATLGYRTSTLLRRYRLQFTALATVLIVAVGLVSFYTVRLAAQRDRALRNEAKARQVAQFMTDMFSSADPAQSRGADITAREILTVGAEKVGTGLAGQPDVQAEMLDVLGEVHMRLGMYDEGRDLFHRSIEVKEREYGDHDPELAATLSGAGRLEAEVGRYAAAESLLNRALEIHRAGIRPAGREEAADLQGLGLVAAYTGRIPESEAHYRRAMAIYEGDPALQGEEYASCLNDYALVLLEAGRRDEAEPMFKQALDIQRRVLGEGHPEISNTLFNLALLYRERGDFKAAEPIQRQVLALDRQHYDPGHPTLAYSLMSLGNTLVENGQFAEAERNFREALEIRRATLEPGHPDIVKTLGTVGLTMCRGGDYEGAEPVLREAVDMGRKHLGRHPITAGRLDDLGWLLHDLGRDREALACHEEALSIKLETIGPDHKNTGITYMQMARAQQGLGDLDAALASQRRAVAIGTAAYGPENLFTATASMGEARILLAMGRKDEARDVGAAALAAMRKTATTDSPRLAGALQQMGSIQRERGETAEAERLMRQALAIRRDRLGPDHPVTGWNEVQLADLLVARGDREEARTLARAGLDALARRLPADHFKVAEGRATLTRAGG